MSARNLYPYEHNFLTQLSYQVSPIVSLSGAFIYSIHEEHPLVINPVVRINLSDRWDLDIIGQHFLPLAKSSKQEDVSLIFCLLYTSDAADERSSVDLGGRRIIKKKNKHNKKKHNIRNKNTKEKKE